jgi:hypothetical protein
LVDTNGNTNTDAREAWRAVVPVSAPPATRGRIFISKKLLATMAEPDS